MKTIRFMLLLAIVVACDAPDVTLEDNRINAYPNPSSQTIYVSVANNGASYSLKGYDNRGKEILNGTAADPVNEYRITITESGTYRFTLDMNNIKGTKSIVAFH